MRRPRSSPTISTPITTTPRSGNCFEWRQGSIPSSSESPRSSDRFGARTKLRSMRVRPSGLSALLSPALFEWGRGSEPRLRSDAIPLSISSAAVELAKTAFPSRSLRDKTVAIVGAGKMSQLAARALADAGVHEVSVTNRSAERAKALADLVGGQPRGLDELEGTVASSDILICSTTAPTIVLDRPLVEGALKARTSNDPLIIVDIAVPRDVDPSVGELPGVTLWDIDDLHAVVRSTKDGRSVEVEKAEAIIDAESAGFLEWQRAASVGPAVASLLDKADSIRKAELERASGRLHDLTADQHAAVDQATRRIVAKLLHTPVRRSKELADSKQGQQYLDALRVLFDLDDDEVLTD